MKLTKQKSNFITCYKSGRQIQQISKKEKSLLKTLMHHNSERNLGNHSENAFLSPNLKGSILKTISSIIRGEKIKENEKRLYQLRESTEYPLIFCELLASRSKGCLMSQNSIETSEKSLIVLQIKKNVQRLRNEQCWWLLRDVYFSDNDNTAKLVRQICLTYERLGRGGEGNNFLGIFFDANLQQLGIVGIVRYLALVYALLNEQVKNLQKQGVLRYGEKIVLKIVYFMGWELTCYIEQFALTVLILLQGFLVGRNCWSNIDEWNLILDQLIEKRKKPLITCLATYLKQQINRYLTNDKDQSYHQQQLRVRLQRQQLASGYKNTLILQSIGECLGMMDGCEIPSEKMHYVDCLNILNEYWSQDLKQIKYLLSKDNNSGYKPMQIHNFIISVIEIYSTYFSKTLKNDFKFRVSDEQVQGDRRIIEDKKVSILKTIFSNLSKQQLKQIISTHTSYQMKIMQLSLHLDFLSNNAQFLSLQQFQSCLQQLMSALQLQQDSYLFYKDKSQLIDTVLRYVVRNWRGFGLQLLLRICYLVDYLAFKCECISDQCYQILDMLTQEVMCLEGYVMVEFLQKSIGNINSNQWLMTNTCYYHVINIITNISPYLIFNTQQRHNTYSLYRVEQLSNLQQQILTMIKRIIYTLKQQFNYQTMHKLNTLLEYLLLNQAIHIIKFLTHQEISWITTSNFHYQIFTTSSEELYFYFCQSTDYQHIFVKAANLYKFWEVCQSEKLQFFVNVYLKLIEKNTLFTSSEAEHKLIDLRKNLWHRFVSEHDQDQRQKIVKVFEKHPKYLNQLFAEFHKVQLWGQNKTNHSKMNKQIKSSRNSSLYGPPKMELE